MKTAFYVAAVLSLLPLPAIAKDLGSDISILVIGPLGESPDKGNPRNEDLAIARFNKLGYQATAISILALDESWLKKHPLVFLPTGWAQQVSTFQHFQHNAKLFEAYVKKGGGLIIGQPNPYEHPDKTCTQKWPYPITFYCMYEDADAQRINLTHKHYLTEDLKPDELPFPHDQIKKLDRQNYQVLSMGARTESPSLVVASWGKGRVVILTGAENQGAKNPVGDKILKRIVTWAAGREPKRFSKKSARLMKVLLGPRDKDIYGPAMSPDKSWQQCQADSDCVRVISPCGIEHVFVNRASEKKAEARWKKVCGDKTPPDGIFGAPRSACRGSTCVGIHPMLNVLKKNTDKSK